MSMSELAKIKQSIAAEMEAARRGLHGLSAGTASHEVISAKMQRMGEYHEKLTGIIGKDDATKFLLETEAKVDDRLERMRRNADDRSLRNIRMEKGLQTSDVARTAGAPLRVVYQAEIGALVNVHEAERILHALSYLTGERYSLDSVSIQVKSGVMP